MVVLDIVFATFFAAAAVIVVQVAIMAVAYFETAKVFAGKCQNEHIDTTGE